MSDERLAEYIADILNEDVEFLLNCIRDFRLMEKIERIAHLEGDIDELRKENQRIKEKLKEYEINRGIDEITFRKTIEK